MCLFCALNCRKLGRRKCFSFTGAESYLHFTTFHCVLRQKMWTLPYTFNMERQKSIMGCFFWKETPECRVWRTASQQLEAQGHSMKLPGSRSAETGAFPFTVRVISMQNCCGVYGLMCKQVPKAIRQNKRKTGMEQWSGCNLSSREFTNCRFPVFLWVTKQDTSVCHIYLTACFILKITFITKI